MECILLGLAIYFLLGAYYASISFPKENLDLHQFVVWLYIIRFFLVYPLILKEYIQDYYKENK